MFFPASLIISCFLIQDWRYLSARLALSSSEAISLVTNTKSECLSTLSSTEATTASSISISSVLNLKKSQLVRTNGTVRMSKLLFNHHQLGDPFLFTLIDSNTIFFL